jgi:hypothetical protein
MRRLIDHSEDSPDEMTELLTSQSDDTLIDNHEVFELKLIEIKTNAFCLYFTNKLIYLFRGQMLLFYPM